MGKDIILEIASSFKILTTKSLVANNIKLMEKSIYFIQKSIQAAEFFERYITTQ
jgi:hypothetical protein